MYFKTQVTSAFARRNSVLAVFDYFYCLTILQLLLLLIWLIKADIFHNDFFLQFRVQFQITASSIYYISSTQTLSQILVCRQRIQNHFMAFMVNSNHINKLYFYPLLHTLFMLVLQPTFNSLYIKH